MKILLFFLLTPVYLLSQTAVRHFDFSSRKQPGLFAGEISISPKGNFLFASFNDLKNSAVYELVSVRDNKLLSSGPLASIPMSVAWSEDEKLLAISMKSGNPVCFEIRNGLHQLFTCTKDGTPVFSEPAPLQSLYKAYLYVFSDEAVYKYDLKGNLADSMENNSSSGFARGWLLQEKKQFALAGEYNDVLCLFSTTGKKQAEHQLTEPDLLYGWSVSKDGSLYLYYDEKQLHLYETATGSLLHSFSHPELSAACFTPDRKAIIMADADSLRLCSKEGKQWNAMPLKCYYTQMLCTPDGAELICAGINGFDVFRCSNNFPEKNNAPATEQKKTILKPAVQPEPAAEKPAVVKKQLPYQASGFITPKERDSFFLYSDDGKLRYYITYKKQPGSVLWANPYSYIQHFGFSSDSKYHLIYVYTLNLTEDAAVIVTSAKLGIVPKDQMIGGKNMLAKIPEKEGQSVTWPMNLFEEQYNLSSKVIDHSYKGKISKCLVVTRTTVQSGVSHSESYYYLLGTGLIQIVADGIPLFKRR